MGFPRSCSNLPPRPLPNPLQHIFNLSISSGLFPSSWKHSSVTPIPKSSPPSSFPGDYRPISLLSLVSKLLEKHIYSIILDSLISNSFFSPSQFGFLPSRSTTSALVTASNYILSSLDSRSSVCGVFLDLKKAFDSVSHRLLLDKISSLNLPSHLSNWLQSYLSGRTQSVCVQNSYSSPSSVSSGIPQGSILGPLLFLVFINDISLSLSCPHCKIILYADDILLLHPFDSHSHSTCLQHDLSLLQTWLLNNSLSLNVSKSKYMIFSFKPQSSFDSFPSLSVSGSPLERVYCFTYLGLLFHCSMSWSLHLASLRKRAKKMVGFLYRNFYTGSSPSTLLKLYTTLVRPILEYCSVVWDPSSSSASSSLESVQFFALKVAFKSWSSSYDSLLSLSQLPTLSHRRLKAKTLLIFKLKSGLCHSLDPPLTLHSPSSVSLRLRNSNSSTLSPIFCRTSAFFHSFFPLLLDFGTLFLFLFVSLLLSLLLNSF